MSSPGSRLHVALLATISLAGAPTVANAAAPASGPATATGSGGAAASVDRNATEAAIATLRHGANAVDAAVTAAAVLGVTEPFSSGIGGGGFMVLYDAHRHRVSTIDEREKAPQAMGPDAFMENGTPLAFNDARYSGMSIGVPGTVRGWATALRRSGTISLAQALKPAIRIARRGFVVDATFADQINQNLDYFDDVPSSKALYLDPDGTPLDVGTTFRNPDLARTYERIARHGTAGFYKGPVADAIVRTSRQPPVSGANHTWRPGVMTKHDLRAYDPVWREPTHVRYRGLDVFGMGPPSSGGSTVGEALNILSGYPLGSLPREQARHLVLEASRLAFADRGAYLADPAFYRVPLQGLLSRTFAASRRARIGDGAATSPVAPGNPFAFGGAGGGRRATGQASASAAHSGSTTHLSVSDRWGDVVSYTFTIESIGGSGIVVPGYGFLLNNELTDFDYDSLTKPNRVQGAKRPRSSISPTIVLRHGRPWLTVGSPGGSTIITTVLQLLTDRIDLGMTLAQAIADPRASERNTAATSAEPAFLALPETAALTARGHIFTNGGEIGAATGIKFLGDKGEVLAAAEPVRRGGGSAMVVRPARPGG